MCPWAFKCHGVFLRDFLSASSSNNCEQQNIAQGRDFKIKNPDVRIPKKLEQQQWIDQPI